MKYKAFGMVIDSAFKIPQAPECVEGVTDVTITQRDLQGYPIRENPDSVYTLQESYFEIDGLAQFRITDGELIEVDLCEDASVNRLSVYLMGSCMGAIMHQRGLLPLHGSCVTDGTRAILLTGNSGAGKSTLAAEFLKQGWKLVTDDVCIIREIDTIPLAQSSYPSQKLWNDSFMQYAQNAHSISLYTDAEREKFGVARQNQFFEGTCPLSLIVRLLPQDQAETGVYPVERIPAMAQIQYNTYRAYMIDPSCYSAYFQKCVTLSGKVPMALALRKQGAQSAPVLYREILAYLENL